MAEAKKTEHKFPSEVIDLPSGGKPYGSDSPLKDGKLELKYMTAKEEDILTSQNLIKKGVVLDKLLDSLILTPGVDSRSLIIGDKNAVMVAARILAYGPEYSAEITNPVTGVSFKYEFDLSAYEGENIRIAFHYVGNDSFVLQTDSFKVEGTLGLSENEISDFEYYYNPFNDMLNMSSSEKLSNIQIFNILGQKIIEEDINNYNHQINLSNLSTSIYFINVESNYGIKTFKLMVQ